MLCCSLPSICFRIYLIQSRNEVSTTSKLACSAACSAPALVTFNTAPSDPLSEEPVYDENVAIDNRKDTLEASSTLGPECSVAACPAPALEDFDQSRNEVSATSKLACSATFLASALVSFNSAPSDGTLSDKPVCDKDVVSRL